MDKKTLARLRSEGFIFDEAYDRIAETLEGFRNGRNANQEQKLLQIRFIQKPEKFGEELKFEILTNLAEKERIQISIYDEDDIFGMGSDTLLYDATYSLGQNKNVIIPFTSSMQKKAFDDTEGNFAECYILIKHPFIEDFNSKSFDVKHNKSVADAIAVVKEIDFPTKLCRALTLTDEQKAKFISTVLGETQNGHMVLKDIAWVYFNWVSKEGFEKGLLNSSFYKDKPESYKLSMFFLGQGNQYANDKIDNGQKVSVWVNTTDYKLKNIPQILSMKKFIEEEIFSRSPINPYVGFIGQGYWGDMMRLPPKYNINGIMQDSIIGY